MPESERIRQAADHDQAHEFVCRAVSAYITNRPDQIALTSGMAWNRIGQTVAIHGLEGVFHHILKDANVPARLRDGWQQKTMAVLFENIRSLRTAVQLFSMLDAAGIPAVAMRGLTLAHKDYITPGMRSMGDIDILISPDDRFKFLEVIAQQGIDPERVLRSQYVLRINGTKFEIHWSFLTAKRYREIFDSNELLSSRQTCKTQDGSIYCLSNEQELIGLVTHAFIHHELLVLRQLLDIGLFMVKPDLDWGYVKEWCRSKRLNRMFSLTFHLVSRVFGLDVEGFREAFGDSPSSRIKNSLPLYLAHYFEGRTLGTHFGMKRNLLYVAEHPVVKLKQFFGFFTSAEAREAWQLLIGSRVAGPRTLSARGYFNSGADPESDR